MCIHHLPSQRFVSTKCSTIILKLPRYPHHMNFFWNLTRLVVRFQEGTQLLHQVLFHDDLNLLYMQCTATSQCLLHPHESFCSIYEQFFDIISFHPTPMSEFILVGGNASISWTFWCVTSVLECHRRFNERIQIRRAFKR